MTSTTPDHGFLTTADMKWGAGPAKEGPFTLRLQLPDGYSIQPHSHPGVEHVTVVSGTFNLGMGEKFDKSAGRALTAGSFAFNATGNATLRVDHW